MSNTNSTAIIAESAKFKGYIAAAGAITLPTSQIAPEIAAIVESDRAVNTCDKRIKILR